MIDAALKTVQAGHRFEGELPPVWLPDPTRDLAQAIAWHNQGMLDKAQDIYRRILEQEPDHADALHLSGVIAHQIGKHSIAIRMITRAIRNQPDNPYYHTNLGTVFQTVHQLDKARSCYRKAIRIKPDYAEAYYNMGNVLSMQGRYADAVQWYREVIAIDADYLDAHYNLANCYKRMGDYDHAIAGYQGALSICPAHAESLNNLGNVYSALNQWPQAEACYKKALAIDPTYPKGLYNLAYGYQCRGMAQQAIAHYQEVLSLDPEYVEAYHNVGVLFKEQGMLSDAVLFFRKVLDLQPDFLAALTNLGNCFLNMGRPADGIRCYRTVLAKDPQHPETASNLLFSLNFDETLEPEAVFREHIQWGRRHTRNRKQAAARPVRSTQSDDRLRVGYVSPDFRDHPVGHFILPVLTGHDRKRFEIFCYSNTLISDPVTERLKNAADCWRTIFDMPDDPAADRIRDDKIDILVDLAGHTAGNRLALFTAKPAPVQVTWLGYPNTTGLAEIQYRLTDAWADPPGMTDSFHTEKLLRLPSGFLCYQPIREIPLPAEKPDRSDGRVRFASFNQRAKLSAGVIRAWSRILSRVPNAQLVLKSRACQDQGVRQMTEDRFADRGVDPQRILFCRHQDDYQAHLRSYLDVDICLDTFPYNGTTTTCDALWMGVPVITLAGNTHVSRVGVSLLSRIGRRELITDSVDTYIDAAVDLAVDGSRRNHYHQTLRQRMQRSSLMNTKAFCGQYESALQAIWKNATRSSG